MPDRPETGLGQRLFFNQLRQRCWYASGLNDGEFVMGGFFNRFRKAANPTDAETAEEMRHLSEAFVAGSAARGVVFGWDSGDASRLDEVCDRFLASRPSAAQEHDLIMCLGAYLGELFVRNGAGRWAFDPTQSAAVVEMPSGLQAYPHNKVAKRLDHGPEHSLVEFYRYGLNRTVSPGTAIGTLPHHEQ